MFLQFYFNVEFFVQFSSCDVIGNLELKSLPFFVCASSELNCEIIEFVLAFNASFCD